MMNTTETFSLWLMPEGLIYARTYAIIKKLHNRFGGPLFEPHITLLSGMKLSEEEAIHRAELLNKNIHSIPVRLTQPSFGNDFYHCFFLEVDLSHPLISAKEKAQDIFKAKQDQHFHPHMSLMYGNIDLHQKKELVKEFEHIRRWEFIVEYVSLIRTGEDIDQWEKLGSYSINT